MRKKKTRRILWGRIITIIVLVAILVGMGAFAINKYNYKKEQERRHEIVAEVVSRKNALDEKKAGLTNTRNLDEESWNSLMSMYDSWTVGYDENWNTYNDETVEVPDGLTEKVQAWNPSKGEQLITLYEQAELPDDYLVFLSRDDDRLQFVWDWKASHDKPYEDVALTESLDEVPHLLQWDERWGYQPYGTSTMVFAGCAPTSLSMVFSYLNQDPTITPYAVAQFSQDNGYFVDGVGTSHAMLPAAAQNWDISCEGIPADVETMTEALNAGKILVLSVDPGDFTRVGHFIVVTGMENGQFIVKDPNSNKNSKLWDPQRVVDQTRSVWAFSK